MTQLFHDDCLARMVQLPSESVDMVFADPPYNLSNGGTTCQAGKRVRVDKGEWDKSRGLAGDAEFHQAWMAACKRLLKPTGTIWVSGTLHSIYTCGYILQTLGYQFLNDISWYKPNAAPNLACRTFTHSHETLLWARRDRGSRHLFNYLLMKAGEYQRDDLKAPGKQMRSVWKIPATPQSEKQCGKHPTQKPIALLERVVLSSTKPGDVVLDPFMGSGTTGVVCVANNREFIGIDSNAEFVALAKRRIAS